jgi:geranylgeranyl pyrophosphate synthase
VYDLKTAFYTFACPLSMGGILGGASQNQADLLFQYGAYLGRAFQIKDDIIGIFGSESSIGKSTLTDLQEAKKTILIWHAYNSATGLDKINITKILTKEKINKSDLLRMRAILVKYKTLDYARREVDSLIMKAQETLKSSRMRPQYKNLLNTYSETLLNF